MKQRLLTIWKYYLSGWVLYLVSVVLGAVLIPAGMIYGGGKAIWKYGLIKGLKLINRKQRIMAVSTDQYGNVACRELFNDTLIKKNSKKRFGKIKDTISAIIGWNWLLKTLEKWGYRLYYGLDYIDKDHCIKAIKKK